MNTKIIQLISHERRLYALCTDGTVWYLAVEEDSTYWRRLSAGEFEHNPGAGPLPEDLASPIPGE